VFHIVGSDVFSVTMLRIHCSVSVATSVFASITLLTTSRLRQKYKGNALCCLANGGYVNAPQGYMTCTGTVFTFFQCTLYSLCVKENYDEA
jgi:hypothetical protein